MLTRARFASLPCTRARIMRASTLLLVGWLLSATASTGTVQAQPGPTAEGPQAAPQDSSGPQPPNSVEAAAPGAPTQDVASAHGTTLGDVSASDAVPLASETEQEPDPVPTQANTPDVLPLAEPEPPLEGGAAAAGQRKGELAGLPALAFNDTFGFVFGVTGSYTRFAPGYAPFRFRTQFTAVSSILRTDSGVRLPLQNIDLRFDLPGLLNGRLRLFTQVRFQRIQNLGYWGLGGSADGHIPDDYTGARDIFFTYEKQLIEGRMSVRYRLVKRLDLVTGFGVRATRPTIVPDSKLAHDLADTDGPARNLLYGYTRQVLSDGLLGLLWDTRDHEFSPKSGGYHELSLRGGGGPSDDRNILYAAAYAHTRWFFPLAEEYLVLALRALADVAVGDVPLIEMGSIGGYTQIAGPAGIEANRGLPYGRQLGKVKVLSTLELRSTFYRFRVGRHNFALGAAAFTDASRVWSQLGGTPGLDGGPAMRVSVGGGPRLLWGRALMLRVDVGFGPKSGINGTDNMSGTLALGHAF